MKLRESMNMQENIDNMIWYDVIWYDNECRFSQWNAMKLGDMDQLCLANILINCLIMFDLLQFPYYSLKCSYTPKSRIPTCSFNWPANKKDKLGSESDFVMAGYCILGGQVLHVSWNAEPDPNACRSVDQWFFRYMPSSAQNTRVQYCQWQLRQKCPKFPNWVDPSGTEILGTCFLTTSLAHI